MKLEVGRDHLGIEGDMACFELRRVAIRVCIRLELVHVVDERSPIAGSLEPGIDLVVARYGGFPLSSEDWKVRIAVMDNTIPVREVSQSICEQEEDQCTTLCDVIFLTREQLRSFHPWRAWWCQIPISSRSDV